MCFVGSFVCLALFFKPKYSLRILTFIVRAYSYSTEHIEAFWFALLLISASNCFLPFGLYFANFTGNSVASRCAAKLYLR